MKFDNNDLSVVAYANGFTLWHYNAKGAKNIGVGFFNDVSETLRSGDIILITSVGSDEQPDFIGQYVVSKVKPNVELRKF